MRFLVQRVTRAAVKVEGRTVGEIGRGFLVFVGISKSDLMEEIHSIEKIHSMEEGHSGEKGHSMEESHSGEKGHSAEANSAEKKECEEVSAHSMELAGKMTKKLLGLRIFEDENGKTNLDLKSVGGSLLVISQFTLYADCRRGNRPSFTNAGNPGKANLLYQYIINLCRQEIETGNKPEGSDIGDVCIMEEGLSKEQKFSMEKDHSTEKRLSGGRVEAGIFGADMKVEFVNDGPFTVLLDSDEILH